MPVHTFYSNGSTDLFSISKIKITHDDWSNGAKLETTERISTMKSLNCISNSSRSACQLKAAKKSIRKKLTTWSLSEIYMRRSNANVSLANLNTVSVLRFFYSCPSFGLSFSWRLLSMTTTAATTMTTLMANKTKTNRRTNEGEREREEKIEIERPMNKDRSR